MPYGRTTRSALASVRVYGSIESLDFLRISAAWSLTLTVIPSAACPKTGSFQWLH